MSGANTRITEMLGRVKESLSRLYGPRLCGVYLFGSYARGEADPESDVDVVVLDRIERYGAKIRRTGGIVSDLSLEYGVSISTIFVTEDAWKNDQTTFLLNLRDEAVAA